jgi:hypothetical protein
MFTDGMDDFVMDEKTVKTTPEWPAYRVLQ